VQPGNGGQEIRKKDVASNIKLLMDRGGYPILSSWEEINREGHKYKQVLISKYMGELYRE
jgi:hypothetical protein